MFMTSSCAACTSDRNLIFCGQAASDDNFVSNGTVSVSIRDKKQQLGSLDGSMFCWAGSSNGLMWMDGQYSNVLGSEVVMASLGCQQQFLFYRQCAVSQQTSIALITVGAILAAAAGAFTLFCCGVCKCWNDKGDDSRWGLCNRACGRCMPAAYSRVQGADETIPIAAHQM